MKKELRFEISKSTAVRSEESVRIPFASSQMILRAGLGKDYSGMGYIALYDPEGRVRLWHLLGHGERELLLGVSGKDTSVGGVPGGIRAGVWKVELFLFTEYIAQFLGDEKVEFVIEVETYEDETAEDDGKLPFRVNEVIGEHVWILDNEKSEAAATAGGRREIAETVSERQEIAETAGGRREMLQERRGLPVLGGYDWDREVCSEAKWYKGDFHTHTTLSDGKETTASAMKKAELTEMDFYVPTEHNAVHTGWVDTELLILPGIEITTERGHCNFFGIDRMPDNLPELMEHMNDEKAEQLVYEAIRQANTRNWIVSINHPFLHIWKWKHGGLKLGDVQCLEIINDPTYTYAKEANDQAVAFLDMLWDDGWKIWGVGGSDSHNLIDERYEGADLPSIAGDPGTFVYCEGLSADELLQRVARGNMYVSRFCRLETDIRCGEEAYLPGDEILADRSATDESTFSVEYHIRIYDIRSDIKTKNQVCVYAIRDGYRELLVNEIQEDGSVCAGTTAVFEKGVWSYMRMEVRSASGELLAYVNPIYHGVKEHLCETFAEAVEEMKKN